MQLIYYATDKLKDYLAGKQLRLVMVFSLEIVLMNDMHNIKIGID